MKAEPMSSPQKTGPGPKKAKELTKADRLEEARKAFKWWEAEEYANGERIGSTWNTPASSFPMST